MFGIGSSEFLVIILVALLVLGPSHLPKIARTLGKAMGEFRRVSNEFQRTLNLEAEREEHEERKKQASQEFLREESSSASVKTQAAPASETAQTAPKPASELDAAVEGTRRAAGSGDKA